jgi:hypothetical protein
MTDPVRHDEHHKYVALLEEHVRLQQRILAMQEEQISVQTRFLTMQDGVLLQRQPCDNEQGEEPIDTTISMFPLAEEDTPHA